MIDSADTRQREDCDGRRDLSEAALKAFREWLLEMTLDQFTFSAKLLDLGRLDQRYRRLFADTIDDKRTPDLISSVLQPGALDRCDSQIVLKTSEHRACTTLVKLTTAECLSSASPNRLMRSLFPLGHRERLFSILFGDAERLE
jgi:hypothetical protein